MQVSAASYPMISVDAAITEVIKCTGGATGLVMDVVDVPLMETCGRVVAQEIRANDPFPPFRASIMDGYAVCGDLAPGVYTVQDLRLLAGVNAAKQPLAGPECVAYITTGAMVPEGANAVVKIEDTSPVDGASDADKKTRVRINVPVSAGSHIRQVGSDIQAGEVILQRGDVVTPADVGLLATVGVTTVPCCARPVVGVMSTGSELVHPWEVPTGSQVRDSNRATLLAAFRQDLGEAHGVDLGIVADSADALETALRAAAARCDVVVTSGGVSMGDADLVKPMLARLGKVHFGRLNMKPGKPTTFATLKVQKGGGSGAGDKTVLVFGLPGNPVSCLVTKTLFIDPALRRLQGMSSLASMHPQAAVELETALTLDPERPEYHRAVLGSAAAGTTGGLVARSTGNQRSSRLLSMKSFNALLCLPQGPGFVPKGTSVTAILTGPFQPPSAPAACFHRAAAATDFPDTVASVAVPPPPPTPQVAPKPTPAAAGAATAQYTMRVGLLTVSDRASQGVYADESGPEMEKMLIALASGDAAPLAAPTMGWPLQPVIECRGVVPDEPTAIAATVSLWADQRGLDLILTSGGTGFGERDLTPEAVRPLLHREAPGVAQALLNEGLKHTPLAVLSRPVVGTRGKTLICTLPGSVKAVRENIVALGPLLPRIIQLIASGSCDGKK